jgi:predicted nucleic acid-binding Zn ribbon protein
MKKIGNLLMQNYQARAQQAAQAEEAALANHAPKTPVLDDQTIFYMFKKMIAQEYGSRGEHNIEARYYKNKKLFVAAKSSLWMSELQLNRKHFIDKMNQQLGTEAIQEIKVESSFA